MTTAIVKTNFTNPYAAQISEQPFHVQVGGVHLGKGGNIQGSFSLPFDETCHRFLLLYVRQTIVWSGGQGLAALLSSLCSGAFHARMFRLARGCAEWAAFARSRVCEKGYSPARR